MIVLTAPTGLIGHQVLNAVLDKGEPIRVIARDISRLPADILKRVEVVQGSHGDFATVNKAFAGADAVFWLVPPDPQASSVMAAYVDFSRPACEAFRSQKVKRVVGISALGRGVDKKAGHTTASLAMDDLIAGTGVAYRALTMPSFMDNLLHQVGAIKAPGMFFSPVSGDLKAPTCATRDTAVVAAQLLLDRSWRGNASVPVMGPEDLSFNDMAKIMSEVLGKPVGFRQIPGQAFKSQMTKFGMSDAMAQAMLDMQVAKNEGLDNAEPRTAQSTTPTSFRQWCQEILKPAVLG